MHRRCATVCRGRRRWLAAGAGVAGLSLLGGCAGLSPYHLTLGEAELAQLLARHFPATQRVAELLELTLASPRLWLLPQQNRLGAAFDVRAAERLLGRSASGRMALDTGLRFDPADETIRLSQVRVQQFQLDAGSLALPMPAQRVGALLAERLLEDLALYRLRPHQSQVLRASGMQPRLSVTGRGLELALALR